MVCMLGLIQVRNQAIQGHKSRMRPPHDQGHCSKYLVILFALTCIVYTLFGRETLLILRGIRLIVTAERRSDFGQ